MAESEDPGLTPMMDQLKFARPFQLWHYTVSHGQLLLRSNRRDNLGTRIDILFKDVGFLALPTSMPDLTLTQWPADEQLAIEIRRGRTQFELKGTNFEGYVIAARMYWHEDEGRHADESHFQASLSGGV